MPLYPTGYKSFTFGAGSVRGEGGQHGRPNMAAPMRQSAMLRQSTHRPHPRSRLVLPAARVHGGPAFGPQRKLAGTVTACYEPGDPLRMILTEAIIAQRDAARFRIIRDGWHERQARGRDSRSDQLVEVFAILMMRKVHEVWHDVADAAENGLPAYDAAGSLLADFRKRWEER